MKRAPHLPSTQTVLSLQVPLRAAEGIADQIRQAWRTEPALLARPGETEGWLEIYFATEIEAQLASRSLASKKEVLASAIRPCVSRDWTSFWKRHFKARNVGARLRVCPLWNKQQRRGRLHVIINPGLSFGTGDHFTTRFCLEMIDFLFQSRSPTSFLDVGAGSGILAIAAARLGARRVVATDHDKQALHQARANAKFNRLAKRIRWVLSDITTDVLPAGHFDIVSANLYATLLIGAAPWLTRATKKHLILSGIREQEVDQVADAFLELGAREIARDGDGEWCGLLFETALACHGEMRRLVRTKER